MGISIPCLVPFGKLQNRIITLHVKHSYALPLTLSFGGDERETHACCAPVPLAHIIGARICCALILSSTVDAYDRHVFLCYAWPPRVEVSDADPLPKRVANFWKARKNDIAVKTKITVSEAREEAGFSDGDVLIFP
ncbi:sucrose cleavage like protein [Spatholobus suberectus]|nr:sucrose cleavage like protein [Spatholobus suberectus]